MAGCDRHDRPVDILLVEDNPADVELTRQGLLETPIASRLHVATDGLMALKFLRREGTHRQAPRPDLVLLDLNMPRMDGREVLAAVKQDEVLCVIPIIVLTTSAAERDVLESYRLHANAFMTKPVDFERFVDMVQGLSEYWFALVRLPRLPP